MQGFSITQGQQGGIGWPPLVIKYKGKWVWVEGSRNHGGSICQQCSRDRGIQYGFKPGGFAEQPKPFGSECYRSLLEKKIPSKDIFRIRDSIRWDDFVDAIKKESGEPEVISV